MSFDEFFAIIQNSTREHWNVIATWGAGSGPAFRDQLIESWSSDAGKFLEVRSHSMVAAFKPDLRISIAFGIDCNEDFQESWANKFPDPRASSHFVDFFFNGTLIHREVYVTLDGGRVYLPLPETTYNEDYSEITGLSVTDQADAFYRLFNQFGSVALQYEEYRERAGIAVVPGPWPK